MASKKSYAALNRELSAITEAMEQMKSDKANLLSKELLKNDKSNIIVSTADVDLRKCAAYICKHFDDILRDASAEDTARRDSQKVKSSQTQNVAQKTFVNTGMEEKSNFSNNGYYQNGGNNNPYNG